MLVLPIKKKWFDMIINGEKQEEYRELKPYYHKRLGNYFINHVIDSNTKKVLRKMDTTTKELIFRNGYSYNSPSVRCLCILNIGSGKTEWGADPNKEYYRLSILKIEEVRNVRTNEAKK